MTSTTRVPVGTTFALDVPDDWLVLNLDSGERIPDQLERLLDQGAEHDEAFRTHRGVLERQLRQVLRGVRERDLDFAALHTTVIADVLPLTATLTVATRAGTPDDLSSLLDQYAAKLNHRASTVSLRDSGEAVRVQFTDTAHDPQAGVTIKATVCQFLIPAPNSSSVTVMTFATPVTERALIESYLGLFSAIADSFEYLSRQSGVA